MKTRRNKTQARFNLESLEDRNLLSGLGGGPPTDVQPNPSGPKKVGNLVALYSSELIHNGGGTFEGGVNDQAKAGQRADNIHQYLGKS